MFHFLAQRASEELGETSASEDSNREYGEEFGKVSKFSEVISKFSARRVRCLAPGTLQLYTTRTVEEFRVVRVMHLGVRRRDCSRRTTH